MAAPAELQCWEAFPPLTERIRRKLFTVLILSQPGLGAVLEAGMQSTSQNCKLVLFNEPEKTLGFFLLFFFPTPPSLSCCTDAIPALAASKALLLGSSRGDAGLGASGGDGGSPWSCSAPTHLHCFSRQIS